MPHGRRNDFARGAGGFFGGLSEGLQLLIALQQAEEDRERRGTERAEDVAFREKTFEAGQEQARTGRIAEQRRGFESRLSDRADRLAKFGIGGVEDVLRQAQAGEELGQALPEGLNVPGVAVPVNVGALGDEGNARLGRILGEAETEFPQIGVRGGVRDLPSGGFVGRGPLQSVEGAGLRLSTSEDQFLGKLASNPRLLAMMRVLEPELYQEIIERSKGRVANPKPGGSVRVPAGADDPDPKAAQRAAWDQAAAVLRQRGQDPVQVIGQRP